MDCLPGFDSWTWGFVWVECWCEPGYVVALSTSQIPRSSPLQGLDLYIYVHSPGFRLGLSSGAGFAGFTPVLA
jgi:hypothetical protein